MCLLSTPGVYNISPWLVYKKNAFCFHNVLVGATVLFLQQSWWECGRSCPVQASLGWWWSQLPPCTAFPAWQRGDRWPRVSSTEQEPQLQSATVVHNWNTLVKLKFVLIPSVGNTVNENRSNQIKIIYFISLRHCKTFQGSTALWCKPEIDAVPLFTSKTTKVKTFKCIKAILLIVSIEDSPLPFLVKYS